MLNLYDKMFIIVLVFIVVLLLSFSNGYILIGFVRLLFFGNLIALSIGFLIVLFIIPFGIHFFHLQPFSPAHHSLPQHYHRRQLTMQLHQLPICITTISIYHQTIVIAIPQF